jgi:quinol monooxygenase YgiN
VTVTLPIIGTFRLPPDRLAAARPVMQRMIDASRAEPGCLAYGYAGTCSTPA